MDLKRSIIESDKKADDANNVVESALENLVSVTEKSDNLRKDLKDLILKSVGSLRHAFSELRMNVTMNNEQNMELSRKVKKLEENMKDLHDPQSTAGQVATSTSEIRYCIPAVRETVPPRGNLRRTFSDGVSSVAQNSKKKYGLHVT